MRKFLIFFLVLGSVQVFAKISKDANAYIVYQQANNFYRNKHFEQAKKSYLKVVSDYSSSKYVPYALYILSFVENNSVRVMDYLSLIRDEHPNFKYWDRAVQRLGEVYYLFGNDEAALNQFKMVETDRSHYLSAIIYSARKDSKACYEAAQKLLNTSHDYTLSYQGFVLQAKSLIEMKKYTAALTLLKEAIKIKRYAPDKGSRLLFYAAKSFFLKKQVRQSFYIFSLLKKKFPFSPEATLTQKYITYLSDHNVVVSTPVDWVDSVFGETADLAFKTEADLAYTDESKAEDIVHAAEDEMGKVANSEVMEYVVRIGSYKDLGVANLVAADLSKPPHKMPVGIYFRDDLYYAEIRGVREKDEASKTASKLISLGYKDTKVIEVVKVTEYDR